MLLCDPVHTSYASSSYALRHVIGNVGKPGLALLVSPGDIILKEMEHGRWAITRNSMTGSRTVSH